MRTTFRSQEVLGKGLIDHQQKVVLEIGDDRWTRQEMIDKLHCGNFVAAANVSRAMKNLGVRSVKDAVRSVVVSELMTIRGIGVTSVYVFMCAVNAVGKDPLEWVDFERSPKTVGTKIHNARELKSQKKKWRKTNG